MKLKLVITLFWLFIFNLAFCQNKEKSGANLDKELIAILNTIHSEDQKYRIQIDEIEKKYG